MCQKSEPNKQIRYPTQQFKLFKKYLIPEFWFIIQNIFLEAPKHLDSQSFQRFIFLVNKIQLSGSIFQPHNWGEEGGRNKGGWNTCAWTCEIPVHSTNTRNPNCNSYCTQHTTLATQIGRAPKYIMHNWDACRISVLQKGFSFEEGCDKEGDFDDDKDDDEEEEEDEANRLLAAGAPTNPP